MSEVGSTLLALHERLRISVNAAARGASEAVWRALPTRRRS